MGWHEGFFTGLHADVWRWAIPDEVTAAQCDFLRGALGLATGARVLDVPCGHGRHANMLAAQGHRVTGVDISQDLLAMARQEAEEQDLTADYRRGDMVDLAAALDPGAAFDAAICLGNSIPVLDRLALMAFLDGLARAVRPGGRLGLDIGLAAENLYPGFEERTWLPIGETGHILAIENSFDAAEGRIDAAYLAIAADGRREERHATMWVYTVAELRAYLSAAGFDTIHVTADIEGTPFELGANECWIVAERR